MSLELKYLDWGLIEYKKAWDEQERIVEQRKAMKFGENGNSGIELLVFCEHPHVYTLGKSGSEDNLLIDVIQLQANDATFFRTNRGGDITYHGPGQIVGYPIFDLDNFSIGIKKYINLLELSIINTLKHFEIEAETMPMATGVWLDADKPGKARKIAAIGVKVTRGITMHGFAFNVNTNLNYFHYINPCGFIDKGVTSLQVELNRKLDIELVKTILFNNIIEAFDLTNID